MKTLVLKSFLALVFFMGSAMISAPIYNKYYGAFDVYPEDVICTVISQPEKSEFIWEINGNRFEFTCNVPGDYYVQFTKEGYIAKLQKIQVYDDTAVTIYSDVRLNEIPLDD